MIDSREQKKGAGFALLAFFFWGGLTPLYFKAVSGVPPIETLANRVIWSLLLVGVLLFAMKRVAGLRAALASPKVLRTLLLAAFFVSLNWFLYIYAINASMTVEAALGYYINPLINVILGMVVLRERLSRAQGLAVLLAALGVANLTWQLGAVPWVGLALALSFGIYGLIRKTAPLASLEGLFMETLLLAPFAIGLLVYLQFFGGGQSMSLADPGFFGLLMLSGPVTALPLIWYASAARRLRYSTIGLFQYLAPTCIMLTAVFVFGEPFTQAHLVTFACIWAALAIYSFDSLLTARRLRRAQFLGKAPA
jgi:chloramphenicol-sensitive protein RarD